MSLLDGALALAITEEEPTFAVDYKIAQAWWVKPFLKFCKFLPLDPTKPMATRTLIKIVQEGNSIGIFPEGRLTVTGALMKVYDGAAMVADKTGSMVVPVRIDGLEHSYFTYLNQGQVRRRLFPKVKVTILEPVKLDVDPELKGRNRRTAAGAALYRVMSDLIFRTTSTSSTVMERVIEAGRERGMGQLAVEDPVTGKLSYGKLLAGAAVLGAKFRKMFPDEDNIGVMLPNANGAAVTIFGAMSAGKVPGVDFGCEVIPGALAIPVTSDAMGILGGQPEAKDKAELDLVAAFVDPVISGKANQQKGSTSPRSDAPAEYLDACNKVAMDAMNVPNGSVKNPFNVITGDWNNGIWTAMYDFWSDKNQTTDDAVAALKDAYDQIFY